VKRRTRWLMVASMLLTLILLHSAAVASAPALSGAGTAQDTPPWLVMLRQGGVAYLLFASPPRIERYDMDAETWLADITLGGTPTALAVDGDGLYVALGSRAYRYNLDGSGETFLVDLGQDVADAQVAGPYLYLYSANPSSLVSIQKTSGIVVDTQDSWYRLQGLSIAPGIGKLFAHTVGIYPSDILATTLNADGTIGVTGDSPYHGDYPGATQTYVLPGEARVAENSGILYNTNDLTYSNSLAGAFTDLAFYGDLPIVLRGNDLVAYSNAFQETGRYTPAVTPLRIAVWGDAVFGFSGDAAGAEVAKIPIRLLGPVQPGEPVDPNGLAYEPDEFALGQGEILYILSRAHLSVFRWSVAQRRYLDTIPLAETPRFMAYSMDTDRLYFAYPSGRMTQIRLADSIAEQPFASLPQQSRGLATAGAYVFACDPSGAWESHYTYSPEGALVSSKDWNYYSREYTWSATNRKMYHFRDDTSPNDLIWEEIGIDGVLGRQQDSPYHGEVSAQTPIRVAPDGSVVVLGSGQMYDATSLAQIGHLSNEIADATWSGSQLYTLRSILELTQLQEWESSYTLVQTKQFAGTPLAMFPVTEGILVVTSYAGQPRFSIWNDDLQEIYHLPIAGFTASPTSGHVPLTVTFANETVGGSYTSSSWDFGDGTSSDQKDPTHTYTHSGTFTVTLTVTGPNGSDVVEKGELVTALPVLVHLPIVIR
jgi:hypothetical protein